MILPLRQRHRRIVISLGVVLPIVFIAGIAARKPVPSLASLPSEAGTLALGNPIRVWARSDLFSKTAVQVRLFRENVANGRAALEFSATRDFVKPDLIVYWVTDNPKAVQTLPDNALLLGSFNSASILLPAKALTESGVLVLYSLANNEIVDVSKPLRLTDLTH